MAQALGKSKEALFIVKGKAEENKKASMDFPRAMTFKNTGGCNKYETTWYVRSSTTNLQYFLVLEVVQKIQYEEV